VLKMNRENETLVFEFGEQKTFAVDGEEIRTDQYGHLEVAGDSFLVGMLISDIVDVTSLHGEMRRFLLAREKEV